MVPSAKISSYSRVVFVKISAEYILSILHNMIVFHDMSDDIYKAMSDFFYTDNSPENLAIKSYVDFIPVNDEAASAVTEGKMYKYYDKLSMLLREETAIASIQISTTIVELLYTLFDTNYYTTAPIIIGNENQNKLFNSIESYIHAHKGHVTRSELETEFNYSGDYIYRIILKYTGLSISDYTTQIRMHYATDYLKNTKMAISDIAIELGFGNKTQFYKKFKEIYGLTPKEYRKNRNN